MVNTYLGRLVYDVKLECVGLEKKKVINNRIAIRASKAQTTFVDVVAWNSVAEIIEKNFKKGNEILFQGKLINKKKSIGNGLETESVAILIDEVIFVSGNKDNLVQDNFYCEEPDFLK